MSAIRHETASAGYPNRQPVVGVLRGAAVKCAGLLMQASNVFAEARMHRAMIEAELYRNRYRHASKNDDELPIDVQSAPAPRMTLRPLTSFTREADVLPHRQEQPRPMGRAGRTRPLRRFVYRPRRSPQVRHV